MKKSTWFASIVLSFVTAATSAQAQTGQSSGRREFGYFLPRARVGVAVTQQIIRCPADNQPPILSTVIEPGVTTVADPAAFVRVDTSHSLIASRKTRLELRQDGTLTAFNASNEGQGGAVISSVLSLAGAVAPMLLGVPPVAPLTRSTRSPQRVLACNQQTSDLIARRDRVESQIVMIRSRIADGNEERSDGATMVALQSEHAALVDRLTLAADGVRFDVPRPTADAPAATVTRLHVAPIDYSPWFGVPCHDGSTVPGVRYPCAAHAGEGDVRYERPAGRFVGDRGFRASLAPNQPLLAILSQGDGSPVPGTCTQARRQDRDPARPCLATPNLYYLRPVPASLAVEPCESAWNGQDCAIDESPEAGDASANATALLPQLSGFYSIRIGRGGLFGSEEAAASFDAQGAPTMLEYGSSSGGGEIAGVIDAVATNATALREARTTELTSRIDRLKARRELEDLLNPPPTTATPAPNPDQ